MLISPKQTCIGVENKLFMISSRGALPTATLLEEVAKTTQASRDALSLSHVQRTWAAVACVLRHHLMHGHSVSVSSKSCLFAIRMRRVASVNGSHYHLREPHFAFHSSFATQYDMASTVPIELTKDKVRRLPLDMVANEAKLPADICASAIQQIFLYIGEAVFTHKLIQLDFAGIGVALIKKDRVAVVYDRRFVDDLFAIDTRKWPVDLRESVARAREGVIPTIPADGLNGIPATCFNNNQITQNRSNSSRGLLLKRAGGISSCHESLPGTSRQVGSRSGSRARSNSVSHSSPVPFTSSATSGRTFEAIAKDPPRILKNYVKNSEKLKLPNKNNRKPLRPLIQNDVQERKNDAAESMDVTPQKNRLATYPSPSVYVDPNGCLIAPEEEESVFRLTNYEHSLGTPQSQADNTQHSLSDPFPFDNKLTYPLPSNIASQLYQSTSTQEPTKNESIDSSARSTSTARKSAYHHQQHTPFWYENNTHALASGAGEALTRFGRRRYDLGVPEESA